jgi:hypothetical protein
MPQKIKVTVTWELFLSLNYLVLVLSHTKGEPFIKVLGLKQ